MADENTQADALRWFLTGASSDGGAQTDPLAALGKYRSSTEVAGLDYVVGSSPVPNLVVNYVGHHNGPGAATITATGADAVAWTSPQSAQGTPVTIANGETKVLYADGAPGEYVRVTRNSAVALAGLTTLTLLHRFNAAVGQRDWNLNEVPGGGLVRAVCLCAKNVSTGEVRDVKVWLAAIGTVVEVESAYGTGAVSIGVQSGTLHDWDDAGFVKNTVTGEVMMYTTRGVDTLEVPAAGRDVYDETGGGAGVGVAGSPSDELVPISGHRIGKEAPSSQPTGSFADNTADDGKQLPGAVSFKTPTAADDADVLEVGDLAAGEIAGIWLAKFVSPDQEPVESHYRYGIAYEFEAA